MQAGESIEKIRTWKEGMKDRNKWRFFCCDHPPEVVLKDRHQMQIEDSNTIQGKYTHYSIHI